MDQAAPKARFHGVLGDWLNRLPTPGGQRFVVAFEHGSLSVELYAPRSARTRSSLTHGTRSMWWCVARDRSSTGRTASVLGRAMCCSSRLDLCIASRNSPTIWWSGSFSMDPKGEKSLKLMAPEHLRILYKLIRSGHCEREDNP